MGYKKIDHPHSPPKTKTTKFSSSLKKSFKKSFNQPKPSISQSHLTPFKRSITIRENFHSIFNDSQNLLHKHATKPVSREFKRRNNFFNDQTETLRVKSAYITDVKRSSN